MDSNNFPGRIKTVACCILISNQYTYSSGSFKLILVFRKCWSWREGGEGGVLSSLKKTFQVTNQFKYLLYSLRD